MAKTFKTTGIALKSFKLGEADRVITFLTRDGKLSAVAKGVRKTASKFGGRLEPGNDIDLVVTQGRNLGTVTQVQIKKARPWLRLDFDRTQAAFAMMEMAEKLTAEKVADNSLVDLLGAALDRLQTETCLPLLILAYDLKALAMTGFLPYLSACVGCGSQAGLRRLTLGDGGLVCDNCYKGEEAVDIDKGDKDLLQRLLASRLSELNAVVVDTEVIRSASKALWAHIAYHVHGDFKTRTKDGWIE